MSNYNFDQPYVTLIDVGDNKTIEVHRNATIFSKPIVMSYVPDDMYKLPLLLCSIVDKFIKYTNIGVNALPDGYIDCNGFGPKMLQYEWSQMLSFYPGMISIIILAALMPLLSIFWIFFQCFNRSPLRCESFCQYKVRLALTLLFFLLLFPLLVCLAFSMMSFRYRVLNVNTILENGELSYTSSPIFTLNLYNEIIRHVLGHNPQEMLQYLKFQPVDMFANLYSSLPSIIGNFNTSLLENLCRNGEITKLAIHNIKEEISLLMMDLTRFIDYTRFIYLNMTFYMAEVNIDAPLIKNILHEEYIRSADKMTTLLEMKRIITNIEFLADVSMKMHQINDALVDIVEDMHEQLVKVFNTEWTDKIIEYEQYSRKMSDAVEKIKNTLDTSLRLKVPKTFYNYVIFFYSTTVLIIFLCLGALFFAILGPHSSTADTSINSLAIGLFKSIIYLMTFTFTWLCMIVILFFLLGATMHNFVRNTSSTCGSFSQNYCDMHNKVDRSARTGIIDEYNSSSIYKIKRQVLGRFYNVMESAPTPHQKRRLSLLRHEASYNGNVFNKGAMLDVFKRSFNLEYMYEVHERISEYVLPGQDQNEWYLENSKNYDNFSSAMHAYVDMKEGLIMLSCQMHIMRQFVFGDLIGHDIALRLEHLSHYMENLANVLVDQMDTVIAQTVEEIEILQHFYESTVRELIEQQTYAMLSRCQEQMTNFRSAIDRLPKCSHIKLAQLGTTMGKFKRMEYALHGIWIGNSGVILFLCPILILCMILTNLYQCKCYINMMIEMNQEVEGAPATETESDDESTHTVRKAFSNMYDDVNVRALGGGGSGSGSASGSGSGRPTMTLLRSVGPLKLEPSATLSILRRLSQKSCAPSTSRDTSSNIIANRMRPTRTSQMADLIRRVQASREQSRISKTISLSYFNRKSSDV